MIKSVGFIYFLLKLSFIFLLVYDINFTFIPGFTSARIAFIIIFFVTFVSGFSLSYNLFNFIFRLSIILIIALLQFFFSGDNTQILRIIFFISYSLLSAYLIFPYIRSVYELHLLFLIAVTLQSIILIVSFFNVGFKESLSFLVIYGGNFTFLDMYRAFGLSSMTGSGLSVIQSIGTISGMYLISNFKLKLKTEILVFISIFLSLVSTVITGRTGLLISLFMLIFLVIDSVRKKKSIVFLIVLFFSVIVFFLVQTLNQIEGFSSEYFIEWVLEIFEFKDSKTVEAINSMPIPAISFWTLIGTGKITLPDLTNASGHDSGYIQTYFSLGLFVAIFFYSSFLKFLSRELKVSWTKNKKNIFIAIIMFLIELKEPFMFKYSFPFFVILSIYISSYEKNDSQQY